MWDLDHREGWVPNNWCFQTVVLEKTLESPLDCKEITLVNLKGNQPWIFTARTDVEVEAPILWPPDAKSWLIRKDPDAGKDWRWEKKGTTEYDMVGWHYRLNGHKFEKAPGDGEGQGSLAYHSPWGLQRVGHNWATEQQQLEYQFWTQGSSPSFFFSPINSQCHEQCLAYNRHSINACGRKEHRGT